jgi:ubiquitin C-terminal hydrolase
MASALQCMLNCAPLRDYFGGSSSPLAADLRAAAGKRGGRVATIFAELVTAVLAGSGGSAVTPSAFKREISRIAPQFSGYQQQDSQELLRCTLDALHEDLNVNASRRLEPLDEKWFDALPPGDQAEESWRRYCSRNRSIVTDVFAGQLCSRVVCKTCGHISPCFDPFLDVSVPIPARGSSAVSLVECFEEFSIEEELGDMYTCARCRVKRRATKRLLIERLPPVLVVHLKRFQQVRYRRTKISTEVTFPLAGLDLGRFTTGRDAGATYSLFAVSCHSGGLGGGHYTAYAKNPDSGRWYDFNDSHVTECSSSSVRGSSAYMLFYQRDA